MQQDSVREIELWTLRRGNVLTVAPADLTPLSVVDEDEKTARTINQSVFVLAPAAEVETLEEALAMEPPPTLPAEVEDNAIIFVAREGQFWPVPLDPDKDPAQPAENHAAVIEWYQAALQEAKQRARDGDFAGLLQQPLKIAAAVVAIIAVVAVAIIAVGWAFG